MYIATDTQPSIKRDIFCLTSSPCETCTYMVISTLDHGDMTILFNFKSSHRNVKTLYNLDTTTLRDLGIKTVIKLLAEWAFDGIVVSTIRDENIQYVYKFLKALDQLPPPYDFQWKKCITIDESVTEEELHHIISCCNVPGLTVISPIHQVKQLTDAGISPACIVVDSDDIETVKYNKLGGIMTHNKEECLLAYNNLKHTLHLQDNHLDYPTSTLVRQILQENQLNEILDSYTSSRSENVEDEDHVISVTLDIDFI